MASYNANINLLAFKQAKLLSGIDKAHPQRGYVCIPVDINEIKVQNTYNGTPVATARVNMWPLRNPQALLDGINRSRAQRGDQPITMDDLHTHTLDLSYSTDFVKAAIKAYGFNLIDKVLAAQKADYAEQIKDQDATDENTALFKVIRSYMQPRLANMYQVHTQQSAQPAQPVAFAQASGAQQWTPPAEAGEAYPPMDDDLPF